MLVLVPLEIVCHVPSFLRNVVPVPPPRLVRAAPVAKENAVPFKAKPVPAE